MRDRGVVSRGLTRPKAQKCINVVHRREQSDGVKRKVDVGSLFEEELEWENKALEVGYGKVLHVFEL